MSRLSCGTWSHLMIDDLVRVFSLSLSLFCLCLRVSVVYVYQKGMVSLVHNRGHFSLYRHFCLIFCRHRSTVNERKMLMGDSTDQKDEPSVQLVLIIDGVLPLSRSVRCLPGSSSSSTVMVVVGRRSSSSEIFLVCELLSHSSSWNVVECVPFS